MKFSKIEIHNFRRINEKQLDFEGNDFFVIIENNSDKRSDFIDAITWGLTGYDNLLGDYFDTELLSSMKDGESIECKVKLFVEYKGQDYCLIRKKTLSKL